MEVDIRQLQLLEALGEGQSLTSAAERLHVTQSALSQRLLGMERYLGQDLFTRNGRALTPNVAGRRMILAARSVMTELRSAQYDVRQMQQDSPPVLRIASQCSANFQWLPPVLAEFMKRCPDAEVRIESAYSEKPIPALLEERIDVAIFTKPDARLEELEVCELFQDEMVAVVANDHPWAKRKYINAGDFSDVHLIIHDAYDPSRFPAVPLPIPEGARPRKVTPMPLVTELIAQLVMAGNAVAVLPDWAISHWLRTFGITTTSLTRRTMKRTWYRAHSRGVLPEHVQAFVECMDAHFIGDTFPLSLPGQRS
ncbi:MAG: LysR family transcriptional regulator [Planctomycetes bacterium]|nr:LysR family transcriptional regulator [Planctomycetota bacterium]